MKAERIRLRCRRPGRNSFAPLFYGRLLAVTEGTVVQGQFKVHLVVRIFMAFWFGCVVVGACFTITSTTIRYKSLAQAAGMIFGPLLMLALGYGMVRFGQWSARDQEREMVVFLKNTLEAAECGPSVESEPGLPASRVTG